MIWKHKREFGTVSLLTGTVHGVGLDCRSGFVNTFEGVTDGIWNKVGYVINHCQCHISLWGSICQTLILDIAVVYVFVFVFAKTKMTDCQEHMPTANIWFVWSKTPYIVEINGDVTNVGQTYYVCTDKKGKIELLSLWTATFITIRRNFVHFLPP